MKELEEIGKALDDKTITREGHSMKKLDLASLKKGYDIKYCTNYTMKLKYFVKWINRNVNNEVLELNPDFQRGHVWSEYQQIKYIENLLTNKANHARSIYLNANSWPNNVKDFVCVDGLQRITAITKYINNELKVFGKYYCKDIINGDMATDIYVYINELPSKEDILKWYLQINDTGTPHSKEEIRRIQDMIDDLESY